jgi:FRG domain
MTDEMKNFAKKIIRSWDEFTESIGRFDLLPEPPLVRAWLFRGQTRNYDLTTKIERVLGSWGIDLMEAASVEFQTVREFQRRILDPEHHRLVEDTLYCLSLMQHFGAPTRLLDCSYSPFVAAAFAMEEGIIDRNPVIWCFRGQWFDEQIKKIDPAHLVESRNDDQQRNNKTFCELYQFGPSPATSRKFVKNENPLYLNERLTAQQGAFLCPADIRSPFVDNLKAMDGWDSGTNILRLDLDLAPSEAVRFARKLKTMNVSFASLFPGLDGFARSIGQQIFHYRALAQGGAGLDTTVSSA